MVSVGVVYHSADFWTRAWLSAAPLAEDGFHTDVEGEVDGEAAAARMLREEPASAGPSRAT